MSELNFRINKNRFYEALQMATRAINTGSPVPSLSGIRIDVTENEIIITGSDSSLSVQVTLNNEMDEKLGLKVEEPGCIVIESRYLMDIVKKIDSADIQIEIIDGTLTHFKGAQAEFKINGFRPEDYPVIDFKKSPVSFSMKTSVLASVISETSFAASKQETRPVLTGVNLKSTGEEVIFTATDSYRLARKISAIHADPFCITVPCKTLNEARNVFANCEEVSIAISEKKIQFFSDSVVLQSTLLDGGYPETDRLIPKEFGRVLIIPRASLISALDRTSFIKTDNMAVIRLRINSVDDIEVSNRAQEIGESHEVLVGDSYEGDPLDISFSGTYVSEAARALSTENIRISFTGEMRPFILQNEGGDDSILHLVLPVRTYN